MGRRAAINRSLGAMVGVYLYPRAAFSWIFILPKRAIDPNSSGMVKPVAPLRGLKNDDRGAAFDRARTYLQNLKNRGQKF
jgi:hypothetical protein